MGVTAHPGAGACHNSPRVDSESRMLVVFLANAHHHLLANANPQQWATGVRIRRIADIDLPSASARVPFPNAATPVGMKPGLTKIIRGPSVS